jgi:2'-5' RNA ligase
VPYAVELYLDDDADLRVREIWAALEDRGIRSLGGIPDSDYHPHVSLAVFDHGDLLEVTTTLKGVLANSPGLPLTLEPLGFFLTEESPAFLGVVPSSRLLALHSAVCDGLQPLVHGFWRYYEPDALRPHCTLAMRATQRASIADVVARFALPISARVREAHLVEIPGGCSRAKLTGH